MTKKDAVVFSDAMVRAIPDGGKSSTQRVGGQPVGMNEEQLEGR